MTQKEEIKELRSFIWYYADHRPWCPNKRLKATENCECEFNQKSRKLKLEKPE